MLKRFMPKRFAKINKINELLHRQNKVFMFFFHINAPIKETTINEHLYGETLHCIL